MKRKMTKLEASRLGTAAMRIAVAKLKQARIDEYNKHPKLCKICGKPISYQQNINGNIFCSSACAATSNNNRSKSRIYHHKNTSFEIKYNFIFKECLNCGGPITSDNNTKFCSIKCAKEYEWKKTASLIKETGVVPNDYIGETNNDKARRYLEEVLGHKCSVCGASEHNGQPIPLQIHHIDGDATNSKLSNLQLLCPTCHAMTDNYSFKNSHHSTRLSRKRYWSTAQDRQDLQEFRDNLRAESIPPQKYPFTDIRDDMISDEEFIDLVTSKSV